MKNVKKPADEKTRIDRAMAILGSKANRETVESCVRAMLHHEWRAERQQAEQPTNATEKKAVQRVADELHRLNTALRNPDLPRGIVKSLPTPLLKEREIELDKMASRPLRRPKPPDDANPQPDANPQKKKLTARTNLRWDAARYASMTLQELGIERVTTRGGTFHKLAAIYYGYSYKDTGADLFGYISFYREMDHLDADEH